ncbi:MAG: carboxypeptidase M32 [Erysipelotrichaceae bacterium]|nr:carboxypeptidase M32 [Erysipelotrichaceae bacterium]
MSYDQLNDYINKKKAIEAALTLFMIDNEEAPKNALNNTSKIMGVLYDEHFKIILNPKVKKILTSLDMETLSLEQKTTVKIWLKEIKQIENITSEEYSQNEELLIKSRQAWLEAKEKEDYNIFKPYLKQVIDNQKRFTMYRYEGEDNLYDVLLNDYEEGYTVKKVDEFFELLKSEIVPLLKKVQNSPKKINRDFIFQTYDIDKQRQLNHDIAKLLGFDFNAGKIFETEHPYTTELHNKDVRISTHYYLNNLESALYSTIHETGHALYEQGIRDDLSLTLLGEGTSMGMHESQSRFYENVIGRSQGFIQLVYPIIQSYFKEQLEDVSWQEFYEAVNHVEASLIRTEADELTYSLHILIRYEIEKMLFNDEITVEELPQIWKQKYEEYLGVSPLKDSEGVLQDIHWAQGSFGYFFSYAFGSALASQFAHYIEQVVDFKETLTVEKLEEIRNILKNGIHQHGRLYNTNELLKIMLHEEFEPKYYIEYLKNKFTQLYGLSSCK